MVKKYPRIGDRRTKSGFLLFPIVIGDEQRWLQRATWIEEYQMFTHFDNSMAFPCPNWEPVEWVDGKENTNE